MSLISDEFAVYLPAVNSHYASYLAKPAPENRPLPSGFTLDDLKFWEKSSKLWHHPHFLHSVGSYAVGSIPDNAVTRRGRTDGVLFGDSGGYQIGKGSLQGLPPALKAGASADDAVTAWRNAYEVRAWIINWLETNTNYAMTIDMPLWATNEFGKDSPFHKCTHQQLIDLTVENLMLIDKMRQDRTKWLNVIQGGTTPDFMRWWNAVKWFPSSGYALSSGIGKTSGLGAFLEVLLLMRDDNAFDAGHDWIHVLGISTAPWAIMFTAMQMGLRATANSSLRISYDSASPFHDSDIYEKYELLPALGTNAGSWAVTSKSAPQSRLYVGSQDPLPFSSPVADKLTLGDLNVADGMFKNRQFDPISTLYLSNHNVWTYLQAFQNANMAAFFEYNRPIPPLFSECLDVINGAFISEAWNEYITSHRMLLSSFAG